MANAPVNFFDVRLGSRTSHGAPATMDLAAVALYDRTLNDQERLQVENYFMEEFYSNAPEPAATAPEPSSVILAALGLLSLGLVSRRRRNR